MPASGIREGLRMSTIFRPVYEGPIVIHKERNCAGTGGPPSPGPDVIAPGHYRVFSPDNYRDPPPNSTAVSITKHATNAAGANRFVTVVLSLLPLGGTQVDIYLRDDAGNLTFDALFVECTIDAMPLAN